jgi:transposase
MHGPVEETLTGYDRKTIKKYLLAPDARPVYGPRPGPVSKLVPFDS